MKKYFLAVKHFLKTKPRLAVILFSLFLLLFAGILLYWRSRCGTDAEDESGDKVTSQSEDAESSILDYEAEESSEENNIEQETLEEEMKSIDQIISQLNVTPREINFVNKIKSDSYILETEDINISVLGEVSSSQQAQNASAGETEELHVLTFQNPRVEGAKEWASKFGFYSNPTYPWGNNNWDHHWEGDETTFRIWPGASNDKVLFENAIDSGRLPSLKYAEVIAEKTISLLEFDFYDIKFLNYDIKSVYGSDIEYDENVILVFLQRKYKNRAVYMDDMDFSMGTFGKQITPSWEFQVQVGPGDELVRFYRSIYGQYIAEDFITMNRKSLDQAIDDLIETGGTIRSFTQEKYYGGKCYEGICTIKADSVDKVTLAYYWNTLLPGGSYHLFDNDQYHPYDYLIPIWLFEGDGRLLVDDSGELVRVPVHFTTSIPAIDKGNEEDIIGFDEFTLTEDLNDPDQIQANFSFKYNFQEGGFYKPGPRRDLKYRVLVLYPDNTYAVTTDFIRRIDGEVLEIPTESMNGTIKVYIELPDFDNVIAKREIKL